MTATLTKPRKAAKQSKSQKQPAPAATRTVEIVRTEIAAAKTKLGEMVWSIHKPERENAVNAEIAGLENELAIIEASALPTIDLELARPKAELVKIAAIDATGNHREITEKSAATIELSKSLQAVGLLEPVAVRKQNNRFKLIFGFRRLAAAKLAGWTDIPSHVYPQSLNAAEEEAVRSAENLHRQELNYLEEARAVLDDPSCVTRGAELLGKSETWVRDRVYLSRLSGDARNLVISGRLGLKQAREIAKLADPSVRDDVAEMVARSEDGTGGWSPERTRAHVHEQINSLKVVPWPLDAKFPADKKIVGPCVSCQFNTANDRNLFEHDGANVAEELAGKCTNQTCFDRKTELSQKALAEAVKTAVKAEKKVIGSAAPAPAIVKETTFKRKLKTELDPQTVKSAPKKAVGEYRGYVQSPKEKAEDEIREANRKWANVVIDGVTKKIKDQPHIIAYFAVMEAVGFLSNLNSYEDDVEKKLAKTAIVKRLKACDDPNWTDTLAMTEYADLRRMNLFGNLHPDALTIIAETLGTELGERPSIETFYAKHGLDKNGKELPKADAEKSTDKKSTKAKRK
jgi:ParB/RepB/Spo0J family partition protein